MRILYAASTELGRELGLWLADQTGADVYLDNRAVDVIAHLDNRPIGAFGDYDLGVSFLYTHKIPAEQVAARRWINFHPGPLPEMRGRNLAYYAITGNKAEFGATLHYMDAEFDTGDIIECRRFPILDTYTAGDLVRISHGLLADMFYDYLPRFLAGEDVPGARQYEPGTYYRKTPIDDLIALEPFEAMRVRALTVSGRYYARVEIGGQSYRIVPEVEL